MSKMNVEYGGMIGSGEHIFDVHEGDDEFIVVYHKDKEKGKSLAETFARIYENEEEYKREFAREVVEKFKNFYYGYRADDTGTIGGSLKLDNFLDKYYPKSTSTVNLNGKEMTREEAINLLKEME